MRKGAITGLFTGLALGTAAATGAAADDAAILRTACASPAPFLVVDSFALNAADYGVPAGSKTIDLDNDGIMDIAHGDMVAKIAELSGRQVIRYGIPYPHRTEDIRDAYTDILAHIEDESIEKPAAVIMSLSFTLNRFGITNYVLEAANINPENIRERSAAIVDGLKPASQPYQIHTLFNSLNDRGVPVITAAGNGFSNDSYNFYGVLGAVSIGALTHDGAAIAPYSNRSSLTTEYRVGDFIIRKVQGGADIDGDGDADFDSSVLSGGASLIDPYNNAAARPMAVSAQIAPQEGLYNLHSMLTAGRIIDPDSPPENLDTYGAYIHYPSMTFLREDDAGRLHFDPAGDGDPSQTGLVIGTSFAAPNICGPRLR